MRHLGRLFAIGLMVVAAQASVAASDQHVVVEGDWLSKLAAVYYEDVTEWQRIYEANRGTIGADPNRLSPGQVLVIPGRDSEELTAEEEAAIALRLEAIDKRIDSIERLTDQLLKRIESALSKR